MGQNQTTSHPLYTKIGDENGKTIVKAGGRLYHLKVLNYPDQQSSTHQQKQLTKAKELINTHLISLSHFEAQTESNFCSTFHRICLLFQYMPHTLATEISVRRSQHNRFNDKQIWSILCSCTLAFSYLQQNNIQIQCFSLQDIMLSDDGVIKLNNPFNSSDSCSSTVFDSSYFYSPEQFEGQSYVKSVSGVYQLGLALLTCIDLDMEEEFYTKNGYVDLDVVGLRLKNATKVVNKDIGEILQIMLENDQNNRPDWIDLQKIILKSIQNSNNQAQKSNIPPVKQTSLQHLNCNVKYQTSCIPLLVDVSDEPQLLCYESEADEERMDENNHDMILTNRFEEDSVLKESRKQQINSQNSCKKNQYKKQEHKKTKIVAPQIVNEEYEGGKYEGQKVNGCREGYGTFHYSQGGIYTGQWHLNQMEGEGSLYYPSGKIAYQGEWKADKLDGFGVLYNEDVVKLTQSFDYRSFDNVGDCWVKYEGLFKNDNKEGKGKLVLSNGEWFSGYFSEDKVNGKGQFFRKDGTKLVGQWKQNVLI